MNEATEPCLEARGLRKRYPNGVEAVRDLSLSVRRGEVLGLAGPNGAGKSTLLKLLAGLLRPESGAVVAEGADVTGSPERAALHVALMPDPLGVYTDVSSREYLEFFGRVFGLRGPALSRRVAEVAEELGLGPWLEAEVETLSAGWQRRLALGRTLLSDAPVLLLDEPAAGPDVGARADLLALVRRLASSGRTLVVSSHILPELQDLADRFAVMVQGRWAQVAPGKDFFTRDELRRGFVCAPGGVRVGVCATAGCALRGVETLRDVSSLCIRVARPVPGAGREVLPALRGKSVLVLSAPGGGKTTFLRELVRVSAEAGARVAVADERGELAGMRGGVPGFDVGPCTDVLTGAPKAEAALMLLRSMSPEIVAMDEIGDASDAEAIRTILGCGVRIFASAHAPDRAALSRRSVFRRLLEARAFDALVIISGRGEARRYTVETP